VEARTRFRTSEVTAELQFRLRAFVREHALGRAPAQECGYRCFPDDPLKVRKPDASYVSFTRLPAGTRHEGHVPIPPDLAAEVVSPHDLIDEVVAEAEEYLAAGVRLVWVVAPARAIAMVFHAGHPPQLLTRDAELDGSAVMPGFRVRVGDLLPPEPASAVPPSARLKG
jgi:Uma2 family endonuclease